MPGEVILTMAYGYDIKGRDDKYLNVSLEAADITAKTGAPGAYLVNELSFRQRSLLYLISSCSAYSDPLSTTHPRVDVLDQL
jgi:hypothetical protein